MSTTLAARVMSNGFGRAAILAVWFVGVSVPLTPLSLQHVFPLARQAGASAVAAAKGVAVRHVLSADCFCSRAVAEYLLRRTVLQKPTEEVWLSGDDQPLADRLRGVGYTVTATDASTVRRALGVAGTPWLIVYARDGREVYSGGYSPRRPRGPDDVDLGRVLDAVRNGDFMKPYPVYGCAMRDTATRDTAARDTDGVIDRGGSER
jgi:hypothetical protein